MWRRNLKQLVYFLLSLQRVVWSSSAPVLEVAPIDIDSLVLPYTLACVIQPSNRDVHEQSKNQNQCKSMSTCPPLRNMTTCLLCNLPTCPQLDNMSTCQPCINLSTCSPVGNMTTCQHDHLFSMQHAHLSTLYQHDHLFSSWQHVHLSTMYQLAHLSSSWHMTTCPPLVNMTTYILCNMSTDQPCINLSTM